MNYLRPGQKVRFHWGAPWPKILVGIIERVSVQTGSWTEVAWVYVVELNETLEVTGSNCEVIDEQEA